MTLAELPIESNRFYFKVEADGQAYSFYIATEPEAWQPVAEGVDGRILSTPMRGRVCRDLYRDVCQQQWATEYKYGGFRLV